MLGTVLIAWLRYRRERNYLGVEKLASASCSDLMNIENSVQLRELQQIRHLPAGIAQLELSPGLSLLAVALRANVPVAIFIFEDSSAA